MNAPLRSKRLALFNGNGLTAAERAFAPIADAIHAAHRRPRFVHECLDEPRPCPWVGCKWHLAIDVRQSGTLLVNFPAHGLTDQLIDWEAMPATCAMDLVKPGDTETRPGNLAVMTEADVAAALNASESTIRTIERNYLRRLREECERRGISLEKAFG